jgi:hypothetical protein
LSPSFYSCLSNVFLFLSFKPPLTYSFTTSDSLAREATIPDYETLPKSILFKKIQESFNIERLERAEARRKRICETKKKRNFEEDLLAESESQSSESIQNAKKARIYNKLNKIDPIMFAPIKKRHTWKFVRPNGKIDISYSYIFVKYGNSICFILSHLIVYTCVSSLLTSRQCDCLQYWVPCGFCSC